jgi:hypothetical protein
VAKYADATNVFAGTHAGPEAVRGKLDVLREHCTREGTDYERIRKTILYVGPLEPTAEGGKSFVEEMARYAQIGIEEVHVMPFGPDPVGFVRGLGNNVVPGLSNL